MESRQTTIDAFGQDILKNEVANHLGPGGIINLARSNRKFYTLFNQEFYPLSLLMLKNLLNHVANGEQQEADNLLKLYPDLLVCRGTVWDAGKKRKLVNRTALQIALMQQDERMYHMIETHFKNGKLPNGRDEMAKQFKEQFPQGLPTLTRYRNEFKELAEIIAADQTIHFSNDQFKMKDATRAAIKAFKDRYAPKATDEFKEGVCFDQQMLIDVLQVYADIFDKLNWNQRGLYCCQVFSSVQSWFSIDLIQLFCEPHNFTDVMSGKISLHRIRKLQGGMDYFSARLGDAEFIFGGALFNAAGYTPVSANYLLKQSILLVGFLESMRLKKEKSLREFQQQFEQPTNQHNDYQLPINSRRRPGSSCEIV